MDNILSIILITSIGISIYRKYYKRYKKGGSTTPQAEHQPQEKKIIDPIETYLHMETQHTNASSEMTSQSDDIISRDSQQSAESNDFLQDFDPYKAVIYSEILKPKFEEK